MSGAVKSVKKVFKKVTKSAIGKLVIGGAVAYLTAGLGASVLGATGLAGSLSPTMTTVLSNALSGAAAGGIVSGVTGGKIGQGIMLGAGGGAIMGGVQSMLGNYTQVPGTEAAEAAPTASSGNIQESGPAAQPESSLIKTATPAAGGAGATAAAAPQESTGLMSWINKNPEIAGRVIAGGAQGALAGLTSPDYTDIYQERNDIEREKLAADESRLAANRASHNNMGLLTQANLAYQEGQPTRPTPEGKWVYRYDPDLGQIVLVQAA